MQKERKGVGATLVWDKIKFMITKEMFISRSFILFILSLFYFWQHNFKILKVEAEREAFDEFATTVGDFHDSFRNRNIQCDQFLRYVFLAGLTGHTDDHSFPLSLWTCLTALVLSLPLVPLLHWSLLGKTKSSGHFHMRTCFRELCRQSNMTLISKWNKGSVRQLGSKLHISN